MKKGFVVSIIALFAALAGAVWFVAKLVKRSGEKLSEDLDYDGSYFDEDYDGSDDDSFIESNESSNSLPEEESDQTADSNEESAGE